VNLNFPKKRQGLCTPAKALHDEFINILGCTIKHYKNDKIKGHYRRALLKDEKGRKRVEKETIIQITPQKEKVKKHKERIAEIFDQMKGASQDSLIRRLNPVVRGWANYYRYIVSSPTFSEMDENMDHVLGKDLAMGSKKTHRKRQGLGAE